MSSFAGNSQPSWTVMKIKLIFLGKTKEKYLSAGINDYLERLKRYVSIEVVTLKERRKDQNEHLNIIDEGRLLLDNCGDNPFVVVMDSAGIELSSEQFSKKLSHWEDKSIRNVVFLIGGHLGLSDEVKGKAEMMLSLSKMTFTHEMARLFLIEQIYRAYMIINNRKYHK